jgi:hypothetical protein
MYIHIVRGYMGVSPRIIVRIKSVKRGGGFITSFPHIIIIQISKGVADEWLGIDFLFRVLKSSFSQSNRWT